MSRSQYATAHGVDVQLDVLPGECIVTVPLHQDQGPPIIIMSQRNPLARVYNCYNDLYQPLTLPGGYMTEIIPRETLY